MNEKAWFWYFLLGLIYIAILVVLVRPNSPASSAVASLSNGLSSLVTTAIGGTPNTASKGILT